MESIREFYNATERPVKTMYWLSFIFLILSLMFSYGYGFHAYNYILKVLYGPPVKSKAETGRILLSQSALILIIVVLIISALYLRKCYFRMNQEFDLYQLQKQEHEKRKRKALLFLLKNINVATTGEQRLNDEDVVGGDSRDQLDEELSRAEDEESISINGNSDSGTSPATTTSSTSMPTPTPTPMSAITMPTPPKPIPTSATSMSRTKTVKRTLSTTFAQTLSNNEESFDEYYHYHHKANFDKNQKPNTSKRCQSDSSSDFVDDRHNRTPTKERVCCCSCHNRGASSADSQQKMISIVYSSTSLSEVSLSVASSKMGSADSKKKRAAKKSTYNTRAFGRWRF